jgi:VanZ family protein
VSATTVSARPDHRSTAWPLSLLAMALVAYASFYPLRGWAWPPGSIFHFWLPKLPHEAQDDLAANVLGYLPLGGIWCLAHLRSGRAPVVAALAALATCSGWSYAIELTQHFLPTRVPSVMDWVLNTLGAAWGVLAALTVHALGWVDLWHRWRVKWFGRQTGAGLALLIFWPVGLLTPLSWPLAEGRLVPRLHRLLGEATEGSVWQAWVWPIAPPQAWVSLQRWVDASDHTTEMEILTTLSGALLPLCVAAAVSANRKFRVGLFTLVVLSAFGATSLSSALNFGLSHALAWMTLSSVWGLLGAAMLAWALLPIRPAHAAMLGVLAALALLLLVHLAPSDPYFAQSLQSWERGLFIKFHGLTSWFSQLWPFAAAAWLIGRCRAGSSSGHAA